MGFAKRVREFCSGLNPLADPQTARALNSIFGWGFGNSTAAGEVVSEFTALQHVSVYACVRVLAESVGSLTLRTYTRNGKGRAEAVDDPLWRMLALTPNDEMAASVLWETVTGCLSLTGNSYIEILRNAQAVPVQLYPLNPLHTTAVRLPTGKLAYRTTSGQMDGGARIIAAADMLHFRLFSWDGLIGLSPIQQARNTIGWSIASLKQSARFIGSGSTPPGILTPVGQVDEQDLVNMRKAWELANGGANSGRTAVLPAEWKHTAIGISNKDSQWLESMQFSRTDIAGLFRLPPHMIGDTSRLSNNNVQSQNLSFVIDTLQPYTTKIEQEINVKLLNGDPSRFVQFDVSSRLRGDFQTTMTGFSVGRQWGILTANDCREQIGMNPLPGEEGNITWAPVNMQDSTRLLTTESLQDQPAGAPSDGPEEDDQPQMRSMFAQYGSAFLSLYKDAVGRVATRSKRDVDSVTPILKPALDSITELIEKDARSQFRLPDDWHVSDKIQRDLIKSAASRASTWTPETRDSVAGAELGKAIRSIYFSVYRQAGAAIVEKGLEDAETIAA